MEKPAPVVYVLHGEDEFAIGQTIRALQARLGDPSIADLNVTHLDGRFTSREELLNVAMAAPFLARRRLVVLTHPLARLSSQAQRDRFLEDLEKLPETTGLVLVEYRLLTGERERKKGQLHWLERWATANPERVFLKAFELPRDMPRWIQERAGSLGGRFTPQAAQSLAQRVGDNTRLADQEIQKLLAYANFQRPVEEGDVVDLCPSTVGVGDFELVNAIRERDGRKASAVLHKSLEKEDPLMILGGIAFQFRLLLVARNLLDRHAGQAEIGERLKAELGVHGYPARLAAEQARQFTLSDLERIYRRLLEVDVGVKTGQMEAALALETLVTSFTTR